MVISFGLKEISNYGESRAASLRPDIAAGGTDAKRGSQPKADIGDARKRPFKRSTPTDSVAARWSKVATIR